MNYGQISSSSQPIWVDVTTLIHWDRPAVGIIRVEQQLCLWLTRQEQSTARFCRYDRARKQLFEVERTAVVSHLNRITENSAQRTGQSALFRPGLKERLRQRVLKSLDRLPPQARSATLKGLIRLRPHVLRLIQHARKWHARLKHRNKVPYGSDRQSPLDIPEGSVYVSLGLDWDYKDMAHLYQLKQEKNLKYLLFCYDIIPILKPHLCVGDVSRQFAHYFADLAWGADLILSISESSRRDLIKILDRLDIPSPPNEVVHLGSDILPAEEENARISDDVARLLTKPYLLFVSTIERRKNHEVLYRAYSRLAEEGLNLPPLIFVGMEGWGTQELLSDIRLDPQTQGHIHVLNHVNDTELALLYRHASFTVFPSLYEGWGLPVAESLAFGKFCLCSNTSSLPEVGGTWVEYIDPWDLRTWVDRLRYYITHPDEVERRNSEISAGYQPHSWHETASTIYSHAIQLQQKS